MRKEEAEQDGQNKREGHGFSRTAKRRNRRGLQSLRVGFPRAQRVNKSPNNALFLVHTNFYTFFSLGYVLAALP